MRYPRVILGTCCIPWTERYELDEDLFRRSIAGLAKEKIRHLYTFGTAGEGYAVTDRQFKRITEVFLDEAKRNDAVPMTGIISLSLSTVIERIETAAALGCREFQLSLPSWGTLTDKEVATFFRETCGRFPELNFLHYNLKRSGRLLTADDYRRLAAEHPNLVATKQTTTESKEIHPLLDDGTGIRHFFTEPAFAGASMEASRGGPQREPGLLISIASCNPERARHYFSAALRGDYPRLLSLQVQLCEMREALIATIGSSAHMDGAYDQLYCKLAHPEFPLRLLPPYEAASKEAFQQFRSILRGQFRAWLPARERALLKENPALVQKSKKPA